MNKSKLFWCLISLLWVLQGVPLHAQQVNPGTNSGLPPFGSFHGTEFDTVNLQNGNLHIEIPILSVKQRGKTLTWKYVYETQEWRNTWYPQPQPRNHGYGIHSVHSVGDTGWRLVGPFDWGYENERVLDVCESTGWDYTVAHFFTIIDPERTRHQVPLRQEIGGSCYGQTLSGPSLDGTGMVLDIQTNTITLKDGTKVFPSLRDTNGNLATAPATDTLNRNLVTITNGPIVTFTTPLGHTLQRPQYTLFQVIDSAGNQQTYRVDYQEIDTHSDMCSHMLPSQYPCFEEISVKVVAQQLTLPNNKTYVFSYNNNTPAELSRVDLPTGGFITYVYTASYFPQPMKPKETGISYYGRRGVSTRTVNVGGNAFPWTYATDGENATMTDPYGNREVREFNSIAANPNLASATPYEISARYYDSNGALLRTVTKEYAAEPDYMYSGAANVRVIRETTTLDNNFMSKRETDYDTFQYTCSDGLCPATATRLNPTEIREYDYGSGSPGPLLRRTDFTYLHTNNSTYTNLNIVDRVLATSIYDGSGVLRAQSQNEYDNYTLGLQASGAVQHDSSFGTGYLTRGNVTAVNRWRNTDGAWLTTRNQYDDAGNVLSTTDPGGHPTTYDYSDSWTTATGGGACAPSGQGKAYLTRVTNSLGHVTSLKYFSCTGLFASSIDPNNQLTSLTYDPMNRPLVTSFPDGGQTTVTYDDSALTVTSTSKITTTPPLNFVNTAYFDALGRSHASVVSSDPNGPTYSRTEYDAVVTCPHFPPRGSYDTLSAFLPPS